MMHADVVPSVLGYRFPAEWEPHASTWLSYPHNEFSWPGKMQAIFPFYHQFIREITRGEQVNINVTDHEMQQKVTQELEEACVDMEEVRFHLNPTNDAWCRDHGPAFLTLKDGAGQNETASRKDMTDRKGQRERKGTEHRLETPERKVIVNWEYNGWGGKYKASLDNVIPLRIAEAMKIPIYSAGIVMEGGSVDVNGQGTLLTTASCLLNPNRNPGLDKARIEQYLMDFYGAQQVLWLGEGIEGDDTDGHVDDLTRFINEDTVITVVEHNHNDPNYAPLKENIKILNACRLLNGKQLNIIEIPMPEPIWYQDQRLPASYANFYITNAAVIVPVFRCDEDDLALSILSECITDRPVVGLDALDIIWGLGSWHCLSQQEPL